MGIARWYSYAAENLVEVWNVNEALAVAPYSNPDRWASTRCGWQFGSRECGAA